MLIKLVIRSLPYCEGKGCLCDEGRVAVIVMSLWQMMKERYNGIGGDKMTDEFMKPIIVDKNGLVQSRLFIVL